MRRPKRILWLLPAALVFAVAVPGQAEPALSFRAIRTHPPQIVALRLLGRELSVDIERIETIPASGPLPVALEIYLYARPVPLGPNYCSQRRHLLVLTKAGSPAVRPLRQGEPLRVIFNEEQASLARAPGCRLAAGHRFAGLTAAANADIAMRALDDLAAAQTAALAAAPMPPIELTCRDEIERDPDRCGSGTREALAHLPLDRACALSADDDAPRTVEVILCAGGPLWVLRLDAGGRLSMLWKYADGVY